jgi:predicted AAA+ superfamily ATPase
MSLADRFGLQVAFQSPDQVLYLHIVKELAKQRQLTIDPKKLEKMATQWELRHSGRSGRLAKQFIDYLEGEESLVD